jgi:hypothetical protein
METPYTFKPGSFGSEPTRSWLGQNPLKRKPGPPIKNPWWSQRIATPLKWIETRYLHVALAIRGMLALDLQQHQSEERRQKSKKAYHRITHPTPPSTSRSHDGHLLRARVSNVAKQTASGKRPNGQTNLIVHKIPAHTR